MGKVIEEKSNNTGQLIVAALVGAAVGGILGVLFAPAKGSDTRKNLLAKGDQLKDTLLEKFTGLMDGVQHDGMDHSERKGENTKNGNITF